MSALSRCLYPAGDCIHCGLPVRETHMLELIAREAGLGPDRPVVILVHTGSGHERCEDRDTVAEAAGQ
jgi:hypothetical protein